MLPPTRGLAGRSWPGHLYENPDDIHMVSRNASDTEPAKFLVHIIKTVGVPVSAPVSDPAGGSSPTGMSHP